MKIGIIEPGQIPAPLRAQYISYPAMFAAQLQALLPGASFTTISVVNGQVLPAPDACDAWLIPGSRHVSSRKPSANRFKPKTRLSRAMEGGNAGCG